MKNKYIPLIVGISLPFIFILIISIVVFTPTLFIKPQHNFIYTTENNNYSYNQRYQNTYKLEDGKIVLEPVMSQNPASQTKVSPEIYLYDVKTNSSHQITLEEAQIYLIDPGPSSPDGYSVSYYYGHDGIFELFGSGNDSDGYFISKGNRKKKLNSLGGNTYWNSGHFKLIGWIK